MFCYYFTIVCNDKMLLGRAFVLTICLVLVLGVSRGPVYKSNIFQNRITRHTESNDLKPQTHIQNYKAKRSNENERKNSENGNDVEVRNPEKDLDDGKESPSKFLYSRRLPTKPIEQIVIENPPHLSVAIKNLDITKRFRRTPRTNTIQTLNHDKVEDRISIERHKRHLRDELNQDKYERYQKLRSDGKFKRHLQNFPVQYENIEKILQSPEANTVIYRTQERSKRYPERFFVSGSDDVEDTPTESRAFKIKRKIHKRTAEPFNPNDDASENEPGKNKEEELASESKMATPFNEPVRPVNPFDAPKSKVFDAPEKPKAVDIGLIKPTAARESLRGLGLPPTIPTGPYPARRAGCVQCTNKNHNHEPYSRSGLGHYYGQSVPRYGSMEMFPGFVHANYPAVNYFINRRFGASPQYPSQIEGRVAEQASNDRNEYPLAKSKP